MSLSTRRKPLSNNTDFNTTKTFNKNNTATSKTNSESQNIELMAKKSKTDNTCINIDNNNNTDPSELPSSSSPPSSPTLSSSNVPKNGANTNVTRMNRANILDSEKKRLNSQNATKKNRKCKKPNEPNSKSDAPRGDPSTTHEKECFLNHNEPHKNAVSKNNIHNNGPQRKGIRPVERERMRDWLSRHLNADSIRGLYWIDEDKRIFRIPWKHGSSQNWTENDAELFVEWAKHTGRYYPDTDTNKGKLNTKRFKATFRCALNSLPDCQELPKLNNKAGANAFKVYQFSCDKETCPYKKKKPASKTLDTCCVKSVECVAEEVTNQKDASPEHNNSQESDQEQTPDTPVNDKTSPPNEEETPSKSPEEETPSVAPEDSGNCIPCQNNSEPDPCRTRSSFDDLTISENDVANTLLELQRGAMSRLIKKDLSQLQPQVIHTPPQTQTVPITHLPMLQSQMPVTPHTQAQIYSQPVLRPKIAKSVLQPQTPPVHMLQSQLTTHREIHPKTQSITYEQTSTMTVVNPVTSKIPSVIPFVPAMVLPYPTHHTHSEHQMTNVCMIPALVPTSATQMMHIHSSSFDNQAHQFVPVAVPQSLPVAGAPQSLPVAGAPQSLPVAGAPQNLPVAGAPQNLPVAGIPQSLPVPGVPQNLHVAAAAPQRLPVAAAAPQRLPVAAAAPQRLPAATVPQRLPAAAAPQRSSAVAAPQKLPVTTSSQRLPAAPQSLPIASPRFPATSEQFSTAPQRLQSATSGLPTSSLRLPVPSPKLQTTSPRLSTVSPRLTVTTPKLPTASSRLPATPPRLPTATPRLPTATPRLPIATPRLPIATPRLPIATPRLPTATPRLPTATPRLPTATPRLPTATPRLPTATVHTSLPETKGVNIKQEVLDGDYSPLEMNINSANHNHHNNNNNNNSTIHNNSNSTTHNHNNSNITVKLENVLTGDLTSGYKANEQKPRKVNQASTNIIGSVFQTNNTQISNRKRSKGKKNATGPPHDTNSNVQITGSSQNYQKKRKK